MSRENPRAMRGTGNATFTVGRGPVPRHAWGDWKPRAGDFRLLNAREGQALALRYGERFSRAGTGNATSTVGRGPVPRYAWADRKPREGQVFLFIGALARDRPSRYGIGGGFRLFAAFARDRPSRYGVGRGFLSPARFSLDISLGQMVSYLSTEIKGGV